MSWSWRWGIEAPAIEQQRLHIIAASGPTDASSLPTHSTVEREHRDMLGYAVAAAVAGGVIYGGIQVSQQLGL